jgi:hypothetical protein
MAVIQLLPVQLDGAAERVRRSHHDAISELQRGLFAGARVLEAIELADGVITPIPHGLGRVARFVMPSCVRGGTSSTGHIEEVRDGSLDRSRYLAIKAVGWGGSIVVDLVVL